MTWELAAIPCIAIWGALWLVLPWVPTESRIVRTGVFYVIMALQVRYLWWRFVYTLPPSEPSGAFLYALVVFALECAVVYPSYNFLGRLLRTSDRSAEADAHGDWFSSRATPLVDILIPTYNESWSILERTIVGALHQDYERVRVWVCDDGRRGWLQKEAERLGAGYLVRSDNLHAKAGNLNSALSQIAAMEEQPEFVAVLDADFIPRRRFISRTMALMHAPNVGIVQTPQHHFNPDPFQRAFRSWDGWPDTQRFMFNVVLPARDAEDQAFCCGTSFLARMSALTAIGGFPTESITEDVLTTMKMRHVGYTTVYLRELLTTGLAAEGLHEYLTQRGRWSLGGVQIAWWVFRLPRTVRSLWQRFLGIEPFLRWGYVSLIRVAFLLIPLLYWIFGVSPAILTLAGLLWYSFPLMALQRCYMSWLSRGAHLPILAQAETLIGSFAVIPGMLKGLFQRRQHRFVVTDKGVSHSGGVVHWRVLRWLIGYVVLTAMSMAYRLLIVERGQNDNAFTYVIVLWSCVTLLTVFVAIAVCFESPQPRREQRYPSSNLLSIADAAGRTVQGRAIDISVSGAKIAAGQPLSVGEALSINLSGLVSPLQATVVRRTGTGGYGLEFRSTDEQRIELIRMIFCSDRYVHPPQHGSTVAIVRAVLRRLTS